MQVTRHDPQHERPALGEKEFGDYFLNHHMLPFVWGRDRDGKPRGPCRGTLCRWRNTGKPVRGADGKTQYIKLEGSFKLGRSRFYRPAEVDVFLLRVAMAGGTETPRRQRRTEARGNELQRV